MNKFKVPSLNEKEHSILLYLLDAIRRAPNKLSMFVDIVHSHKRSENFEIILQYLKSSKDLLTAEKYIRKDIT